MSLPVGRRYAVGAELSPDDGVHFRVWAPGRDRLRLVLEAAIATDHEMTKDADGYFSVDLPEARAGDLYRFKIDDGEKLYPDPMSRFQPQGPHGPSQIIDAWGYRWSDMDWKGIALEGQVIYELHVGTFTQEGTWAAAEHEIPELASAGITCIEVMPVADFPGDFGWGYDGVNLFAPTRLYGTPDDFRRFVDVAHQHGVAVILDVVYNHLGPDGNYLKSFSPAYFTDRYKTEWGEAINFDGPDSRPVRDYFVSNAAYWIDEFHLDGLRLDATQNIYDSNPVPAEHILAEVGRAVRKAAKGRGTIIVNENEPQHPNLVRPLANGGVGLDALWNDDFHHSAMVALTGHHEAYYTDYRGSPQEFISSVKYGYLYQGQHYSWQSKDRGQAGLDLPPAAFVTFIQNHDQIANTVRGLRAHRLTSPGRYRAMTAFLLLAPGTPMLFMGQEFAADAPFHYFAHHEPDLGKLVEGGRLEFLQQFPSITDPTIRDVVPGPNDRATFEKCKLDFADRKRQAPLYQLTKDLLRLRREDGAFRMQKRRGCDGAVLAEQAFVVRFFAEDGLDRLIVVNLGRDLYLQTCPEPLLAPPSLAEWQVVLSTENPTYGGNGTRPQVIDEGWHVPGESALVLKAVSANPSIARTAESSGKLRKRRIIY